MDDTREGIFIRQDSLMQRKWVPPVYEDENSYTIIKEGFYETKDVTECLPRYLWKPCWIEEGTTLRDFFKLLNNHKNILDIIFGCHWFKEWLEYGLRSPDVSLSGVRSSGDDANIECFELSVSLGWELPHKIKETNKMTWSKVGSDIKTRIVNLKAGHEIEEEVNFVYSFSMMSEPLTEKQAIKSGWGKEHTGKRVPYGFFGCDICQYMELPLTLSCDFELCKSFYDEDDKIKGETTVMHNFYGFKLFDIINEIFYEISFNGSPETTRDKIEQIHGMSKDVEEMYDIR